MILSLQVEEVDALLAIARPAESSIAVYPSGLLAAIRGQGRHVPAVAVRFPGLSTETDMLDGTPLGIPFWAMELAAAMATVEGTSVEVDPEIGKVNGSARSPLRHDRCAPPPRSDSESLAMALSSPDGAQHEVDATLLLEMVSLLEAIGREFAQPCPMGIKTGRATSLKSRSKSSAWVIVMAGLQRIGRA